MLELLRDKRTMMSMIALPLLVFPLLFTLLLGVLQAKLESARKEKVTVGVVSQQALGDAASALKAAGIRILDMPDLQKAVESKKVSAAVRVTAGSDGTVQFDVLADESRDESSTAGLKVNTALENYKDTLVSAKLRSLHVPESVLAPVTIRTVNIASKQTMGNRIFGGMVGELVLILMFVGGMYPAIDTGAGEKERHTIEGLLASPASRTEIISGKIAACATAALLTAFLSLISFTLFAQRTAASVKETQLQFSVGLPAAASILLALVPIAIFEAALMVALSTLAKSYKEGQAYVMPAFMVLIFPIILGTFVTGELTPWLALIPFFNTSLAITQIFAGTLSAGSFSVALLANLVYAGLITAVTVRVFRSETVLFRT